MKNLLIILVAIISLNVAGQTIKYDVTKQREDSVFYTLKENYPAEGTWINPSVQGGVITYTVNLNQWNPGRDEFNLLVNNGAIIEQCALVLRIPRSAIDLQVSASLSNRTYATAAGTAVYPWGLWFLSTGRKVTNDYLYVLTKDHTGRTLSGAEVKLLLDLSGAVELMGQQDEEYTSITN